MAVATEEGGRATVVERMGGGGLAVAEAESAVAVLAVAAAQSAGRAGRVAEHWVVAEGRRASLWGSEGGRLAVAWQAVVAAVWAARAEVGCVVGPPAA